MTLTFIIPTIGRPSLKYAIKSLKDQTIKNWNAIIIFDGINCNIENNDPRIQIIEIEKKGININSAGNVRNHGMSLCQTKWIAFLDDDDVISPDYIETFYKELELYSNIDVLIFRMYRKKAKKAKKVKKVKKVKKDKKDKKDKKKENGRFIPRLDVDNFYICDVGISFIIKKEIYDNNFIFKPSNCEDFEYLNELRSNNYKIMISPYTKYFVRKQNAKKIDTVGSRVLINT